MAADEDLFGVPGQDVYDIIDDCGHGRFSEARISHHTTLPINSIPTPSTYKFTILPDNTNTQVHSATDKSTGHLVALKHMHLDESSPLPRHIQRELLALQSISHPNIISLLDTQRRRFGISLVLDYCPYDLWSILHQLKKKNQQVSAPFSLPAPVIKHIIQQLLQAIAACHAEGFIHRDIAPANVLISSSGNVKLADFGQARKLKQKSSNKNNNNIIGGIYIKEGDAMTPQVGTQWYRAPELLLGSRHHTLGIDMWSIGCLIAELIKGEPLFPGRSDIDQLLKICEALGTLNEEKWPGVVNLPHWGKLLLPAKTGLCWKRDVLFPTNNGDTSSEDNHCTSLIDLVSGMLRYDPSKRTTAADALKSTWFTDEQPVPATADHVKAYLEELM